MSHLYKFILIFSLCGFLNALEIFNLDGNWILEDAAQKYNLKATVPGGVYTDLMNNEILDDVFFGSNDVNSRWVAKTNWTYSRDFSVPENFLNYENVVITFEGIDTFSKIYLNDNLIGSSNNMFVRYTFDIKQYLKVGNNAIKVEFASPIEMAEKLASKQDYVIPPACPPDVTNGDCHWNQIRKMQSSFSWDWGPSFPSMGLWKSVNLEAYNSTIIRYVVPQITKSESSWTVNISVYLDNNQQKSISGKLSYRLEVDNSVITQIDDVNTDTADNEVRFDHVMEVPELVVRRWWPNGYGEQKLYNLTVTFTTTTENSSKSIRIGFRTIELIQDELDSGLTFYFKVNDIPIFAKGANEIPLNVLPEKGQDPNTIINVLGSAQKVHMNMLRVWGGGVYESDYFYDVADEMGILIWQDFMFACAMYPSYPDYLKNVEEEIRQQVKRLSSHPSIALWAGNNENEAGLVQNWFNTTSNQTLYKSDYIKLYIDTIKTTLKTVLDEPIFVTSSPSNGKKSDEEGYLAKDPGSSFYGDVHWYNYILDPLMTNTYPIPRFASEYGYQSLPSVESWLTTTNNLSDLDPYGNFIYHRQHHPYGKEQFDLMISYQLVLPNSTRDDYIERYIYYTQLIQALSIKFETEYYRSFQGRYTSEGKGNTMGALFWQLNDVWVAPTWSGIDYTGKWKMLHYYAYQFFYPTLITGYLSITRELEVYAISDLISLVDSEISLTANIDIYRWDSFTPVHNISKNITLGFGKSVQIATFYVDDVLSEAGCGQISSAKQNCFFYLSLMNSNKYVAPPNFVLPDLIMDAKIPQVNLQVDSIVKQTEYETTFNITLKSDGIALFVLLDSPGIKGKFSKNGFIQIEPTTLVQFYADQDGIDVEDLKKSLTVRYLNDKNYNV